MAASVCSRVALEGDFRKWLVPVERVLNGDGGGHSCFQTTGRQSGHINVWKLESGHQENATRRARRQWTQPETGQAKVIMRRAKRAIASSKLEKRARAALKIRLEQTSSLSRGPDSFSAVSIVLAIASAREFDTRRASSRTGSPELARGRQGL